MIRQDAKSIFLRAIESIAPSEWSSYLDDACGDDEGLRHGVERLLAAHQDDVDLADQARALRDDALQTTDQRLPELIGAQIGPYALREQIGEGGFGIVYLAEQERPVRRRVALKVIKPGMETREVVARFEAERQALALMDHPNIAQVHDGGTTPDGRPFFVMELVKGIPITEYCDQCTLTTRERLDLFSSVCQAVQHAHQKGVIHRDLKPSNVLVAIQDGKPRIKVIDFGVAKAMGQRLSEHTIATGFHQMIGTPMYMSPEQAEMSPLDVDTRADIYALGVLLYELLTGTTPFEEQRLSKASYDELRRIIREEEPPRPSALLSTLRADALSTVAEHRRSDPKKLTQLVRGELDWIVMKALEKDRNRRYETVAGFARDIERYLHDEPVQACPPSVRYRFIKFARRNKSGLAIAACLLLAVTVSAASIGWLVGDKTARTRETEAQVCLAFQETTEALEQGNWPGARLALARAEGVLSNSGARAEHHQRAQELRTNLEMAEVLEEIRLYRVELREGKWDYVGANARYVKAFAKYGIDVDDLQVSEAAARIRSRSIRIALVSALGEWAHVRRNAGKEKVRGAEHLMAILYEADPLTDPLLLQIREAIQRNDGKALAELASQFDVATLTAVKTFALAMNLHKTGAVEEAVALLLKAHRNYPNDFWINHELGVWCLELRPPRKEQALRFLTAAAALRPHSASVQNNLGVALIENGLVDDAISAYEKAIRIAPNAAYHHGNLGDALAEKGREQEAVIAFRKALELDGDYLTARLHLGRVLGKFERLVEAEAEFQESIRRHPKDPEAHNNWGLFLCESKNDFEGGIAAFRQAIILNEDDPHAYVNLAMALLHQAKLAEAEAKCREAIRLMPEFADAHHALGRVLAEQRKLVEAEREYREAIRLKPDFVVAHVWLGIALATQGKVGEAEFEFQNALQLDPNDAHAHANLGVIRYQQGQLPEAEKEFRECLRLDPKHVQAYNNLGQVLNDLGKWPDAEAHLRRAIDLKRDYANAYYGLGNALLPQGKLAEAIDAFEGATRLNPKLGEAYFRLGQVFSQRGDFAKAITNWEEAIELSFGPAYNALARLLASCPDPKFRAPGRAIELAQKAVSQAAGDGGCWNTLGVAQYRAGNFQAAIQALNVSMQLRNEGDSLDWFFLAMAHWQMDRKDEARNWYERAVAWMDKNSPEDEELCRFRTEAEELLGMKPAVDEKTGPVSARVRN